MISADLRRVIRLGRMNPPSPPVSVSCFLRRLTMHLEEGRHSTQSSPPEPACVSAHRLMQRFLSSRRIAR